VCLDSEDGENLMLIVVLQSSSATLASARTQANYLKVQTSSQSTKQSQIIIRVK